MHKPVYEITTNSDVPTKKKQHCADYDTNSTVPTARKSAVYEKRKIIFADQIKYFHYNCIVTQVGQVTN